MSSTGRGGERSPRDSYPTPAWCVDRILEALSPSRILSKRLWLEPCAGSGNIISAIETWHHYKTGLLPANANQPVQSPREWTAIELEKSHLQPLARLHAALRQNEENLRLGSFLDFEPSTTFDVCFTNAPYSLAIEFVRKALEFSDTVVMLFPQSFLSSDKRQPWISQNVPDQYVLPNRPSFGKNKDGKKGTDSNDYAWMVWHRGKARSWGKTHILNRTSVVERERRTTWLNSWKANLNPDPKRVGTIASLGEERRIKNRPKPPGKREEISPSETSTSRSA